MTTFLDPDIRKLVLSVRPHLYDLRLINYRAVYTYKRYERLETGEKTNVFAFYTSWSGVKYLEQKSLTFSKF